MTEGTLEKVKEELIKLKKVEGTNSSIRKFHIRQKNKDMQLELLGLKSKDNIKSTINDIYDCYSYELDDDMQVNVYVYSGSFYEENDYNKLRYSLTDIESKETVVVNPKDFEEFCKNNTVIYPKVSDDFDTQFSDMRAEFIMLASIDGINEAKKYMYKNYNIPEDIAI